MKTKQIYKEQINLFKEKCKSKNHKENKELDKITKMLCHG